MASKRKEAQMINKAVKAYIEKYGCGDAECDTCKYGVAIGLNALDKAFNAGAKAVKQ
jgi:ferredoxin